MPRKSFSIHSDYYNELCGLTTEQRGDVLLAFINWANDGEIPDLDPVCAMLFRLMKAQSERISIANSANGAKGGKRSQSETSETSEKNEAKRKKPTVSVSDTVSVTSGIPPLPPIEKKTRKTEMQEIWDSYIFSPLVSESLKSWGKYKKEKRQEYEPEGLKSLFSQVQRNIEKYGEDAVIELITESMGANYQGITWDKLPKRKDAHNASNRGRDHPPDAPDTSNPFLQLGGSE